MIMVRNFRLADSCTRCDNCKRDEVLDRLVCIIDRRVLISSHNVCDDFVMDQQLMGYDDGLQKESAG